MARKNERIELVKGSYENIVAGDLIEFPRNGKALWAVYMGDEHLVHLKGNVEDSQSPFLETWDALKERKPLFSIGGNRFAKAYIRKEHLWKAEDTNGRAFRNNEKDRVFTPLKSAEVAQRAHCFMEEAQYKPVPYNRIFASCESFVNYCRYNVFYSQRESRKIYTVPIGMGFTFGFFLANLRLAYLVKHIRG